MAEKPKIHIIGAGLSGLSAAIWATQSTIDYDIYLYEARQFAGGRCRSFYDKTLKHSVDNGTHLLLGANQHVFEYLDIIGATKTLQPVGAASFPFYNLNTGAQISIGSLWNLRSLKLLFQPRFLKGIWDSVIVSILNTSPATASKTLLLKTAWKIFKGGKRTRQPFLVEADLGTSFIDPALTFLTEKGVDISFGISLKTLESSGQQVEKLLFSGGKEVSLKTEDRIILALPPYALQKILPDISVPDAYESILNLHFDSTDLPSLPQPFIGLIGGISHWVFQREKTLSVTVSAANHLLKTSREELVQTIWQEITQLLETDKSYPPYTLLWEKKASFAQDRKNVKKRPPSQTPYKNLLLAGDFTKTGLPATIEGAIVSGKRAIVSIRKTV
ncbi:MAG: hydroxysqualene dehydroxylase [Alphaproteobacteria bacterium]